MRVVLVAVTLVTITLYEVTTPALADEAPRRAAVAAPAVKPLSPALASRYARLFGVLRPELKAKIGMAARIFAARMSAPLPPKGRRVEAAVLARQVVASAHNFGLTTTARADIDALVELVMMQALEDADEDLRAILQEMEKTNQRRAEVRAALTRCKGDKTCAKREKPPPGMTAAEYAALLDELADKREAAEELGETMRLKLEAMLERRSKFEEVLSNLLRGAAETQAGIVSNLK